MLFRSFNTVAEMIAYAKSQAGGLAFASPGNGTLNHLTGERFAFETGTKMLHIPYKGGGPAGAALASDDAPKSKSTMIALPYEPPAEYDLRITGVRKSGNDALGVRIPRGDRGVSGDDGDRSVRGRCRVRGDR